MVACKEVTLMIKLSLSCQCSDSFKFIKMLLVRRHSIKSSNNCAFCDKSTKFGTCIEKCIINRSGYWAIINFTPGALSNHSKCSKFLFSLNILSLCFHVLDLCFLVLILCYRVVLYVLLKTG